MQAKKAFIVFTSMVTVVNSTMGSALPSNAIPYFTEEWGVTSQIQHTLPIAIFLVGTSRERDVCFPLCLREC